MLVCRYHIADSVSGRYSLCIFTIPGKLGPLSRDSGQADDGHSRFCFDLPVQDAVSSKESLKRNGPLTSMPYTLTLALIFIEGFFVKSI